MKMRRLTAYVAGSVTLAAGVISYAAIERPNFYSAAVYLSQSNACLMILCNLALVLAGGFMYTLQHALFGPLRPSEVEQLWERGWFAVMEWIFAMSTFRDEFGIWFLTMFLSLFTGKVWGWIAEGRVEQLEQQDPVNARLFHGRLIASLTIYLTFAIQMFLYSLDIVLYEAKPGMTIMFVFEFAILWVCALSTCLRYVIWIQEHHVIKKQMAQALEARKAEIRRLRREAEERRAAGTEDPGDAPQEDLPNEDDIDETDIDVAGWEAKRGWLFALDITTDLLKLLAYVAFFTILTVFYGIPIYIIRDLYMTMRSFSKRITDYVRYQAATRDMHARYPDATAEHLASDNTCIVCREEMRPFNPTAGAGGGAQPGFTMNERQRPKKLPCGHILHFSCLQSWLERQQNCPICRGSVFAAPQARAGQAQPANGQAGAAGVAGANNGNQAPPRPPRNEGRVIRLGPLRIQFGGRVGRPDEQELVNILARIARERIRDRQTAQNNGQAQGQRAGTQAQGTQPQSTQPATAQNGQSTEQGTSTPDNQEPIHPAVRSAVAHMQLNIIETQIRQEIASLGLASSRLNGIRALMGELDRARGMPQVPALQPLQAGGLQLNGQFQNPAGYPMLPRIASSGQLQSLSLSPYPNQVQQSLPPHLRSMLFPQQPQTLPLARAPNGTDGPANVPEGMVLPPGWNILPLNPIAPQNSQPTPTISATEGQSLPVATTAQSNGPPAASSSISPLIGAAISAPVSAAPPLANRTAVTPGEASGSNSASTAAPALVPTPTWSFPSPENSTGPSISAAANEAAGSSSSPLSPVPRTSVRPPTPPAESSSSPKTLQPTVEDAED